MPPLPPLGQRPTVVLQHGGRIAMVTLTVSDVDADDARQGPALVLFQPERDQCPALIPASRRSGPQAQSPAGVARPPHELARDLAAYVAAAEGG
jgi:hypothetical protein